MNRKGRLRAKSLVYILLQLWPQTSTGRLNNIPYPVVMRIKWYNIHRCLPQDYFWCVNIFLSRFLPNMKEVFKLNPLKGVFKLQFKTIVPTNSEWTKSKDKWKITLFNTKIYPVSELLRNIHYLILIISPFFSTDRKIRIRWRVEILKNE